MIDWGAKLLLLLEHYEVLGLFCLAFLEAALLPIAPSLLLIPMVLAQPQLGLVYAAVGAGGSILGSGAGYGLGSRVGLAWLQRRWPEYQAAQLQARLARHGGWLVALTGASPLPFTIITIGSGLFRLPLRSFIPAAIVGRGAHFFGVALLVICFGHRALLWLEHFLSPVKLALLTLLLLGAGWCWRHCRRASR